jgi:UDPglucose 6-dehydrogenase
LKARADRAIIVDSRNLLDRDALHGTGFEVVGIGIGAD